MADTGFCPDIYFERFKTLIYNESGINFTAANLSSAGIRNSQKGVMEVFRMTNFDEIIDIS